ncbi:short chain dehydrogenase [Pseudoalteromonas sp. Of7M-16]|uniref:short chain dehydrogenase n=1 Tax=Pseudoalteromonas sp. Of7M-16 TaxID=2917756 RepID=UPI001EF51ACC|nr:short chain dehydrogenase [Pseudoalteromonas sp. Of7M-16]MCG7547703.1 short chain dehydrogenase [Pseudoalteromonas sp. Of7M-16]
MKILLIGATGTIGKAVHARLAQSHEVLTVGHKDGEFQVDLQSKLSIQALFEKVGEVDAIISTTGMAAFAPLSELTDEQYELGWQNKLMGQINLYRVGAGFVNAGGSITLTSGMLSEEPMVGSASISAVNGALNAFVKAAALELGDSLRINAVSPIFVKETMEMMGMDSSTGMSAANTAITYQAAIEGVMTGQVLDVREFV